LFDQVSAYEYCFKGSTDFEIFFGWYHDQENLENEERVQKGLAYQDKLLNAVRSAIYIFLPSFSDLKIMRKDKLRMVVNKGEKSIEVNQMSDGEKCTLAMIGDLARRLAIANPVLNNPLEGNGIVLIDELELHLHPDWQRKFVTRLEATFPNIQFIITTHSPQVLGELINTPIFILHSNEYDDVSVSVISSLFGKDSNMILEQYMGASSKNIEIKEDINTLFEHIMNGEIKEATEIYIGLKKILGNEPDLVKAELLLKRKGGNLNENNNKK
jgi:predicted ATP-binding protein involved in virulence